MPPSLEGKCTIRRMLDGEQLEAIIQRDSLTPLGLA
jgi:hypothetical protein